MDIEYFTYEIKHETESAYLITDDYQDVWIPKSQIEDEKKFFSNGIEYLEFGIPEWLASDKGLG